MEKEDIQLKALQVQQILEKLYTNPQVPLNHQNDFQLLIAIVLSAQTTDKAVNKITDELFQIVNTPEDMINVGEDKLRSYIQSLGLSNVKSKNIIKLSQALIDNHASTVPNDLVQLEKLPGVGHKSASCIMIHSFKQPAFPVDTHIHRLAQRWQLTQGKNVDQTESDLKKLYKMRDWGKVSLQIVYFGREYCPAKNHVFGECPICSWAASSESIKVNPAKQAKKGPNKQIKGKLVSKDNTIQKKVVNISAKKSSNSMKDTYQTVKVQKLHTKKSKQKIPAKSQTYLMRSIAIQS